MTQLQGAGTFTAADDARLEALAHKLLSAPTRTREEYGEEEGSIYPEDWVGPCVYFVSEFGAEGPVKIGHTTDIRRRLRGLQTSNALELEVLCVAPCLEPENLERAIHYRLSTSRLQGEWFRRTRELEWLLALVSGHFCTCCQDLLGPSASLNWLIRHWAGFAEESEKPEFLRPVAEIDAALRAQGVLA